MESREKWQRSHQNKMDCRTYLVNDLKGFLDDPPDTNFQGGYVHAMCDMAEYMYATDEEIVSLVIRCRALWPSDVD